MIDGDLADQPPLRAPTRARADLPDRADAVVIGGSLAGLAVARELARAGNRVVVLEARADVGRGVVGRDPGVITGGLPEHPWRLEEAIGTSKTNLLYGLSRRGLAAARARVGGGEPALHAAVDQRELGELDKSAETLRGLGETVERLDAEATNEALQGTEFTGAMRVTGECAVDVEALVHAVAREAEEAGATIVVGTAARRIRTDAKAQRVETEHGDIEADAVVVCGDHHMRQVLPPLDGKIIPVREHAIRLPRDAWIPAGRAQYGYVTWRSDADHDGQGGLRLSGCRWATQHMEVLETDERPRQVVIDKLLGFAARHFGLEGREPTHTWARILSATCDGLPILGPMPGDPTVVCCLGFQGYAAALALAAGEDVARGLLTGRSPLPDWLAPSRFL